MLPSFTQIITIKAILSGNFLFNPFDEPLATVVFFKIFLKTQVRSVY